MDRIEVLDGVRGLAATSVFVYHGFIGVPWVADHLGRWVVQLNLGVRVFFVLSGFLIAGPFARAALGLRAAPAVGAYAVRRTVRIFPAYWLALFVVVAFGEAAFRDLHDALGQITLTFLWWPPPGQVFSAISVSGTVVIELAFYLFVPLWFGGLRLVQRVWPAAGSLPFHLAGCALLIALGGLAIWRAAYGDPGPFVVHFGTALPALAAGMALALLSAGARSHPALAGRLSVLAAHPLVWWAAALVAFLVLAARDFSFLQPTSDQQVWQWTWEAVVAVLVVAPVVLPGAAGRGGVTAFLGWRPVAWVGLVSYGLYLWHGWTLSFIDPDQLHRPGASGTLRAGAVVTLAYLGALALAALSWYLLERPLQRTVARLVGGRGSTAPVRRSGGRVRGRRGWRRRW